MTDAVSLEPPADGPPPEDLLDETSEDLDPDALVLTGAGAEAPGPVYTTVEEWVTSYFLPMFRRTLGGEYRWCAQWWRHGEAVSRLGSLWHAWESLRHRPGTGMAAWYHDHLDHQLPILMGARGPFYQCSETTHREPHQAAAIPAPGEWWDHGDRGSLTPTGAERPVRAASAEAGDGNG